MHVVRHQDESVKLKAIFGSLFHEHIEEELSVGFDLEETAAICGCGSYEVSAKVLRGSVHVGMIADGRGAFHGPEGPFSLRLYI